MSNQQGLIDEITSAFQDVRRGNGVTLHEATVIDSYGSMEERAKARKKDTERRWQDVPDRDIANTDAVLSFLDAEGLRYYLPAYIVWYLRNIDNDAVRSSNTFDSVVFHLTYQIEEREDKRFEGLTPAQGRAIAHFLIFVSERREDSERQIFKAEMEHSGMTEEDIDPYIKAYYFEGSAAIRQALSQYWNQFL